MKLTFWGAARTTTGSMHLIETNGTRVALDCGMFQGRRSIAREINETFPCPPGEIDAVVLSHAHIDHCGNLPSLVRRGFKGPIFCTHPTEDLCRVMLLDSAYIQEKDAQFASKLRRKKGEGPVTPLYTVEDAEATLPLFQSVGYYREVCFAKGVCGKFLEAGHILGSAIVELDVQAGARTRRVVFSGDIGREDHPILREPEIPSDTEVLILESTYGDREREPEADIKQHLKEIVERVVRRGGKIIIPAFSVGRTQEIVYHLNNLFNEGLLPPIPVYVDSPLSNNVTQVFRTHPDVFNRATRDILREDPNVFGFERLTYVENVEESKKLNGLRHPAIIIAASGMCEAGRILHHLRNSVEDPKNLILIVGYMAEHTLGRRIADREESVRIFGQPHRLRAEVEVIHGLSAHADQRELKDFAFRVAERGNHLRHVFLVHGEDHQQLPLAEYLREALDGVQVHSPERGQSFEID
jgi:metallo-beta-lactamase family protein